MNKLMKYVLIALGLLAVCIALLVGVKSQGVWVLSAVAVVLFLIGLLGKDGSREGAGEGTGETLPGSRDEADQKRDGSDGR